MVRAGSIDYVVGFELEFGLPIALPAIDLRPSEPVEARSRGSTQEDCFGWARGAPEPFRARSATGWAAKTSRSTDANLALGRLDPEFFLGGRMTLDRDSGGRRVEELGAKLGTRRRRGRLGR